MSADSVFEDQVQAEARALARAAGVDPDAIAEAGEAEPMREDRGDGVEVVRMRRPLRPNWAAFSDEARRKLRADATPSSSGDEEGAGGAKG